MITKITKIFSYLILLLFPSYCYICRKEGFVLCATCLRQFPRTTDTPAPYITSMYSFKNKDLKKIIHAIKYFHRKDLLTPLAVVVSEEIKRSNLVGAYTLVPIPMPRLRRYIRGYNHTEELARKISAHTSIPLNNTILTRNSTEKTKRQVVTRSRFERLHNQHNTFAIQESPLGENIILLDDVTTTGATLHEARRVLLAHGAQSVIAFTIAH